MTPTPSSARQVVVLSGKGGTGKTTVAAALAERAALDHRVVLVDADVDAANLALLLDPHPRETHRFAGMARARVDPALCAGGRVARAGALACRDACRFGAVKKDDGVARIDALACEGCGACLDVCPAGAIALAEADGGTWWLSDTRLGTLVHAELLPGEESSGRLVARLREAARERARAEGADLVLIDGPPGIACPAIAATTGCDLAVVVTEPTLSGRHDARRALDLLVHFDVPALFVVNRADLAPRVTRALLAEAARRGLGEGIAIPWDGAVPAAVRAGRPVCGSTGKAARALLHLWTRLEPRLAAFQS